MKVAILTWCFSVNLAFGNKLLTTSSEANLISRAVIDVINKSFQGDVSCVNIITVPDKDGALISMNTISNEVVKDVSAKRSVRVADLNNVHDVQEKRFYNVLLVTSYKTFQQLIRIIDNELFHFQGFFLVVMAQQYENQYIDMEKIFRNMWQHFIINVNVLISSSDTQVEMFTYYPYTSVYCGRAFPILTNTFVNGSFVRSHHHYDDKLKNLFACPLRVVTFNIPPMMFVRRPEASGRLEMSGIDGELLKGELKKLI
jgi:hypothetical protein